MPQAEHVLYKNRDKDAPESIKDANGDVVLGLCRVCGKGERDLQEPCKPQAEQLSEDEFENICDWGWVSKDEWPQMKAYIDRLRQENDAFRDQVNSLLDCSSKYKAENEALRRRVERAEAAVHIELKEMSKP